MKDKIRYNITFPEKLVDLIDSKRFLYGLSFPEYVRHILVEHVKDIEVNKEKISKMQRVSDLLTNILRRKK